MLEPPKFIQNDYYDGARTFAWLADLCGLSVDLINFLICQISALFLASLFRSFLHPSKVSAAVRHTFALTIGLTFGYFCFGKQAIHIAGLPTICYVVIRTQDPRIVQRSVLLVAMTYLLFVHLMRQIYDYGSYALDITGPLMIITQKVTSLAFSIHDGFVRQDQELTKAQQYHAIHKMPTALEYFSYVWHFQSLMAGPLVFYKDYIEFVEGYNLLKCSSTNGNIDSKKTEVIFEPSPMKSVIKKVIGSLICAFIFMKFVKIYPVKNMKDNEFLEQTSIGYKFWYAMMATTCTRFKYYHAWLLADAICNNSGLGFTGYDKDGNAKWDLISNINVFSFEFATNMRDAINNWNCGTNRWLRSLVYERVPKKYSTMLTFTLSAVWHGFYPGYYLTFATGAVIVTAARVARRLFRYRFQSTQFKRIIYDILTCLTTRLVMGYTTFPFVLLELMGSIRLYLKFYLCIHIISLVTIFILPLFIQSEKHKKSVPPKNAETEQINDANMKTIRAANTKHKVNDDAVEPAILANELNSDTFADVYESDLNDNDDDDSYDNNGIVVDDDKSATNNANLAKRTKLNTCLINRSNKQTNKILHKQLATPAETITLEQSQQRPTVTYAREAVTVQHDQCEMDQLSSKIKEKIEAETKNIEEFIDKTVTDTVSGIVEFKKDLMRNVKFPKLLTNNQEAIRLRKCTNLNINNEISKAEESGAFLKKEIEVINAVVQQANVLPAVLSNGHAK